MLSFHKSIILHCLPACCTLYKVLLNMSQIDLKFIRFRNKIEVLNEKLAKNETLKKYFERNCLFELAKITEVKCKTIKKRKNRLVNNEIFEYTVSISSLREQIKELKHHRKVIKYRLKNCATEHHLTKYHCERRERKCAWRVTGQSNKEANQNE